MLEIDVNDLDFGNLFDVELAFKNLPFVLEGLPMTIAVSFTAMAIGLLLGFFLALGRQSKNILLRWPSRLYISFMRGTPILVFLFILYSGLPMVGIQFSGITAAILGFGLNSAAYIAEINRASLNSVSNGQWESAKALGFNYWQTLTRVVTPQAVRIALPPLTNVFLDIVKATSLAAVITVPELFQKAQIVGGRTFDPLTMYILIAFIYWPLCILISAFQERLEKRFSRYVS
ncbi:amino acid ABC transporter permease [Aquibacillus koreensis]|uniref:Amino acid ABC transporter permease n=1 Tax=Aquibacillus koreensis TaxID=279446 RepID=A0A9X3WQG7_9BACI|nr:amino acid ABC transporter permease [Aquibacillus koreensis]MCT2534434.1 amino acid ABC transporter permease [Aquibacillus koreensis]MDC3421741.1 amino acid ABC transporter permease [Aquibacillus koreensis]